MKEKESNVSTENKFLKNKINQVENANIDFVGQTIFEKLDDAIQFFSNPLNIKSEEGHTEFEKMNALLKTLKQENRRLAMLQNNLLYGNRMKMRLIEELKGDLEDFESQFEMNY